MTSTANSSTHPTERWVAAGMFLVVVLVTSAVAALPSPPVSQAAVEAYAVEWHPPALPDSILQPTMDDPSLPLDPLDPPLPEP